MSGPYPRGMTRRIFRPERLTPAESALLDAANRLKDPEVRPDLWDVLTEDEPVLWSPP